MFSNASFKIVQKMKVMKIAIKMWCKEEQSEDMHRQSLFQDIETSNGMEGKDALSTEIWFAD